MTARAAATTHSPADRIADPEAGADRRTDKPPGAREHQRWRGKLSNLVGCASQDREWRGSLPRISIRLLIALVGAVGLMLVGTATAAEVTNAGDDLRTGWYPDERALTPHLVSGDTFGQLWSAPVDGQVYAQPLLAPSGTLIVATESDNVYGLDPGNGTQQWRADLGTPLEPGRHSSSGHHPFDRDDLDAGDRHLDQHRLPDPQDLCERERRRGSWTRWTSRPARRRPASRCR